MAPLTYATFAAPSMQHPRAAASTLARLCLTWCLPLVRQKSQLNVQDIWHLEDINTATTNTKLMTAAFDRTHSVFWAGLHVYSGSFFLSGVLNLLVRLLDLAGPVVLQNVVAASGDSTETLYYWLAALLLAKTARAMLWSQAALLDHTLSIRFVAGLKGMLFGKMLKVATNPSSSGRTNDDEDDDDGDDDDTVDLSNVYSSDMEALLWASSSLHNIWVVPTQVLAICYLLYIEIGLATFAGGATIVLSLVLGSYLSTIQSEAYENVADARDGRMGAVKETFGAILTVKLQSWETKCRAKIDVLRATELGHVHTVMFSGAFFIFSLWAAPLFVSAASFAVYTLVLGQPLTATKVFTSLALFRQLQLPISEVPDTITSIQEARVSLQRIMTFLQLGEKPTRQAPATQPDPSTMVTIENGSFAWGTDNQTPILANISLTISRGDLVVVHGKVGSGKSSLCHAIMGEMTQTQGTTGVYGSIAYASQEAWIQQMSVRDNILFGASFDSAKYTRVVDACGLLPDFA
ncbi:hypothetical protein As57867_005130, partial [Aphanomyces stellatus]